MSDRIYSVRVDGHEITTVILTKEQYKDQRSRDFVRQGIAETYGVPTHYLRLHQIEPKIKYATNIVTGKQERINNDKIRRGGY